jgi:protein SCO1/2
MKHFASPGAVGLHVRVLAVAWALALAAVTAMAGVPAMKAGVFDPPRQAPGFSLQGSNGQELTMSHYRGKVILLAFGFTSCTEVCPTTLNTFALARRKLGPAAQDVQVIYITVDPERDLPVRMAKYLGSFDPTFIGGTGTQAQLALVRRNYGISAEKKILGDDYAYAHSSFAYLIDRSGRLRALMPYGHSPEDYANDLTILLKE